MMKQRKLVTLTLKVSAISELLKELVEIRYERNDIAFERSKFRVRGSVVEIWPAYLETALRIEYDKGR